MNTTHVGRRPVRTFMDVPYAADPAGARIAILGASYGTSYRSTDSLRHDTASTDAPGAIRAAAIEASTTVENWDFDLGGPLLPDGFEGLVDLGDLRGSADDGAGNRATIEAATRAILQAGAVPILLGGDDSVAIPYMRAFESRGRLHVLQIDAHIDWRDEVGGERDGYSSTMRRASELPWIDTLTQVGMRGAGSARAQELRDAMDYGARIVTAVEARRRGADSIVDAIPPDAPILIALDCDALDPSVAPGVNALAPGGLLFHEAAELIHAAASRHVIAGFSIVELAPARDVNGVSASAAARLVLNAVGLVARQLSEPPSPG